MKLIITTILSLFVIGVFAQEKRALQPAKGATVNKVENENSKTSHEQVSPNEVRIEKSKPAVHAQVSSSNKNSQPEKTVEYYDTYIESIRKKVEWVKSNPEEDAKAKENGWYEQMEQFVANAKKEREELLNK